MMVCVRAFVYVDNRKGVNTKQNIYIFDYYRVEQGGYN